VPTHFQVLSCFPDLNMMMVASLRLAKFIVKVQGSSAKKNRADSFSAIVNLS